MKVWAVKVSYLYEGESYKDTLETDVSLFASKEKAVAKLKEIIRNDWTTTVMVDGEEKMLADCVGYSENPDSPKWGSCFYREDGMQAWAFFNDEHGYKGEIVEVEVSE